MVVVTQLLPALAVITTRFLGHHLITYRMLLQHWIRDSNFWLYSHEWGNETSDIRLKFGHICSHIFTLNMKFVTVDLNPGRKR